jgi:hypothetical protein
MVASSPTKVGWFLFRKGEQVEIVGEVPPTEPLGPQPSKDHHCGLRLHVKLDANCGPGDVREFTSTSTVVWTALDELHSAYVEGVKSHPGMLPVAVMTDRVPVPAKQGVAHQPVFRIVDWAPRPRDFPNALPPPLQTKTPEPSPCDEPLPW